MFVDWRSRLQASYMQTVDRESAKKDQIFDDKSQMTDVDQSYVQNDYDIQNV